MIVVDASGTVGLLADRPRGSRQIIQQRLRAETVHAPHLLDAEVAHVLRRLVYAGDLAEEQGRRALENLRSLPVTRYPHYPLLPRVWALRHNLTAYDALYVALSEELRAPIVTLDRRLRDASGHRAVVEVL